ncbi:hypothetical protein BP5796_04600 [Coleophoma crateriformis]|uniref:DUF726-domain-containing protein n=1 Tax=Coleophoma crateriformis TaxID=565419 RepID=A0A3D8S9S1_9HELO|nr:hypothetical protein BP5796_04600 [Coleophoma crateriformis]
MAPISSDPHSIRAVLTRPQCKALPRLISNITSQMRSRLSNSFEATQSGSDEIFCHNSNDSPVPPYCEEEGLAQHVSESPETKLSKPRIEELKRAALKYFDTWQAQVMKRLGEVVDSTDAPPYTPKPAATSKPTDCVVADQEASAETKAVMVLREFYPPTPTKFTTLSKDVRQMVLSSMLLLLLSLGHYSAHSRVLLLHLTASFDFPLSVLTIEETEISRSLLQASKELTADAETQKRQEENKTARRWKVGLASVAGAALIGVTGGLATPVVAGGIGALMGGVGLGGLASFLGVFFMNGALVGTLFGAFGGKMTGTMVDAYAKEVEDFKFLPVKDEWGPGMSREDPDKDRKLRVTIGINGWLTSKEDVIKPWRCLGETSEVFALRYEMQALLTLGNSLNSMVSSHAWSLVKSEILRRTVLASLWSALWPLYLLKIAASIDSPFGLARVRSNKAGEVLADALINKAQGERPVTLIGYSLGARVICSCLNSLASRKAFGIVESVILIGAPVPSNSDNWRVMKSVVSGRMTNVYSENDYILAFLYRATSLQYGIAGLQPIKDVEGVENLNLSKEVSGHLRYPGLIGQILMRAGYDDVRVQDGMIEKEDVGNEILLFDAETEIAKNEMANLSESHPHETDEEAQAMEIHLIPEDPISDDDAPLQMIDNDPEEDASLPLRMVEAEPEPDHHIAELSAAVETNLEMKNTERTAEGSARPPMVVWEEQKSLASIDKLPQKRARASEFELF